MLKVNARPCRRMPAQDVGLDIIVPKLSSRQFDRLNRAGFDFDAVKRERIGTCKLLVGTDLASWQGKASAVLLRSIYDKIKDLKTTCPHAIKNRACRWRSRGPEYPEMDHVVVETCP